MKQLNIHTYRIPANAICADGSIYIAAPPERVASVYRAVERWDEIFPATIASARIVRSGNRWKDILVAHKQEGLVLNTLFDLSETEIGLEEQKKKFDAWFTNCFLPAADGGTLYSISGYLRMKGIYRLLMPLLTGYIRQRMIKSMRAYVLVPLKMAAEKEERAVRMTQDQNRRSSGDDESSVDNSYPRSAGNGLSLGKECHATDRKF